ncbi:MAG: hypothetical protein PHS66_02065 [Candidatus Omnitrophica bacterium]|nr:hypothetical protein [Candidatus Omnitrophota bacterium]
MDEKLQNITVLENMHKLFLEALRHREQEIFHYLAILGPALVGFGWILYYREGRAVEFACVTIVVLALLLLGAIYSLALGYNYRYIVLELAKLEAVLKIKNAMLVGWPRSREEFLLRYRFLRYIPWCTPPEIIKVFWWAFLVAIILVMMIAYKLNHSYNNLMLGFGLLCLVLGSFLFPIYFGRKLRKNCKQEPEAWIEESTKSKIA